jgi:hypothetical protein
MKRKSQERRNRDDHHSGLPEELESRGEIDGIAEADSESGGGGGCCPENWILDWPGSDPVVDPLVIIVFLFFAFIGGPPLSVLRFMANKGQTKRVD